MKTNMYIKPELIIINLEIEDVMASSRTINSGNATQGATYSRERNFWEE